MRSTRKRDDRAQTTLDFAIGMGVFLITIAFVFTFIPSMTAPFVDGGQDHSAVADRTASHLTQGALASPDSPFVLEESCATVFFDEDTDDEDVPEHCGYSGETLHERIGVDERTNVHVEIVHVDPEATGDDRDKTVCATESGTVFHADGGTGFDCDDEDTVRYTTGDRPAAEGSVTTARRIVTIPGCQFDADACDATLRVTVW